MVLSIDVQIRVNILMQAGSRRIRVPPTHQKRRGATLQRNASALEAKFSAVPQ